MVNNVAKQNPKEQEVAEITKDLELTKIHNSVTEITSKFKYEIMRCIQCPILLECSYPKKRLEALKEEAKKIAEEVYEEEIELDNSAENILRAQNKRDLIYNDFIRDNSEKALGNDRCIFERREVIVALQKFVDAGYDISDPRAYMIIQELIGNMLISGRANKAFTNLGVLLKRNTPAGPIYYSNPMLKPKVEFSKLIMEATESLDRMLKSDTDQKMTKNFTDHLLKELRIREQKRGRVIDVKIIDSEDENGPEVYEEIDPDE